MRDSSRLHSIDQLTRHGSAGQPGELWSFMLLILNILDEICFDVHDVIWYNK